MSKEYVLDGKVINLFTIGELGRAVQKQPVTIRKWESTGILPPAEYRDGSNRRLYTKEQLDGLAELTAKYMKQGTRTPAKFIEGAKELFEEEKEEQANKR